MQIKLVDGKSEAWRGGRIEEEEEREKLELEGRSSQKLDGRCIVRLYREEEDEKRGDRRK